jgi:hypothetical protein
MSLSYWGYWLIPITLLACAGARRFPALMLMAFANVVLHMFIAHKEYRFILLSTTLYVLLAAVVPPNAHDLPAAFREERCFGLDGRFPAHAVCIYRRPGACDPRSAGAVEINHYLRAIDR